jgi:hypothetical protein
MAIDPSIWMKVFLNRSQYDNTMQLAWDGKDRGHPSDWSSPGTPQPKQKYI